MTWSTASDIISLVCSCHIEQQTSVQEDRRAPARLSCNYPRKPSGGLSVSLVTHQHGRIARIHGLFTYQFAVPMKLRKMSRPELRYLRLHSGKTWSSSNALIVIGRAGIALVAVHHTPIEPASARIRLEADGRVATRPAIRIDNRIPLAQTWVSLPN